MVVLIELIIVLMILSFVARMARGVFLFLLRKDVLPVAIVVGIVYVFVFVLDINYSVIGYLKNWFLSILIQYIN